MKTPHCQRVFHSTPAPPWFENLGKWQVKAPKIYVRDSGLLHALLGSGTARDLEHHPKISASWEGYAVEEVIKPSMRIALADLKLDELIVVYPGERRYRLEKRVEVVPLAQLVGTK